MGESHSSGHNTGLCQMAKRREIFNDLRTIRGLDRGIIPNHKSGLILGDLIDDIRKILPKDGLKGFSDRVSSRDLALSHNDETHIL